MKTSARNGETAQEASLRKTVDLIEGVLERRARANSFGNVRIEASWQNGVFQLVHVVDPTQCFKVGHPANDITPEPVPELVGS